MQNTLSKTSVAKEKTLKVTSLKYLAKEMRKFVRRNKKKKKIFDLTILSNSREQISTYINISAKANEKS